MGKQYLKVLTEPGPPGDICPRCGKRRPHGQCPHRAGGRHQPGRCKRLGRNRTHAAGGLLRHVEHTEGSQTPGPGNGHHRSESEASPEQRGNGQHVPNALTDSIAPGLSCQGPHCVNLNFLRELPRLNKGLASLQRQEKSLVRYLARVDQETVQQFVLSLLLEPMFESIELAYGAADELRHYVVKDPALGSPCPFTSLINGMDRRLRLYLRMEQGLDEEAGAEMAELFNEEDVSSAQILAELSVDQRDEQNQMPN